MIDTIPALCATMSSRKLQALAFIESYYRRHGVGPSMNEIAAALGCNRMRAMDAVHKLAGEGRIHRVPGVARSIRPLSADEEAMRRLRHAGYIVTKSGLPARFVLDHDPEADGQKEISRQERRASGDRGGPQAAH